MNVLIDFDAWQRGLIGGLLIGLSAAMLMLFSGRVAGISGIVGGLLFNRDPADALWRKLFVVGLLLGPLLLTAFAGAPAVSLPTGWLALGLGGVLVGFGTRLGNGCTSGHGVCGMARFSKRSIIATLTFMAFGFLTVFVLRHGVTS